MPDATGLRPDPLALVAAGYDALAERYEKWATGVRADERQRYLDVLTGRLPAGARVLELGCGSGLQTRILSRRFEVTAVDISARQLALARASAPGATFIHADMTAFELPATSFDAACAFYSLGHVPADQHGALLRRVAGWLRAGGLLVASFGIGDNPGWIGEWLGVPMYFSSNAAATTLHLAAAAGLHVERSGVEVAEEAGQPVAFLWLVARRTDEPRPAGQSD